MEIYRVFINKNRNIINCCVMKSFAIDQTFKKSPFPGIGIGKPNLGYLGDLF